jgi:tRNA-specific 2-thiouridylase
VELGCDVLVTGHHARITRDDAGWHLRTATDPDKDQSYVLHMLDQSALARVRLPVGEMAKSVVRDHARRLGLRTADKPDSQDLCFVGHGDYRGFLREHFPDVADPGDIVDTDGNVVGSHGGTVDFTIGQRKGLGVTAPEPRYVVDIRPASSTVVIGHKEDLLAPGCQVEEVSWIAGTPPADPDVTVKLRYRSPAVPAAIDGSDGRWEARFVMPQAGVTPGQAAVFYRGDEVLGGGTIAGRL